MPPLPASAKRSTSTSIHSKKDDKSFLIFWGDRLWKNGLPAALACSVLPANTTEARILILGSFRFCGVMKSYRFAPRSWADYLLREYPRRFSPTEPCGPVTTSMSPPISPKEKSLPSRFFEQPVSKASFSKTGALPAERVTFTTDRLPIAPFPEWGFAPDISETMASRLWIFAKRVSVRLTFSLNSPRRKTP